MTRKTPNLIIGKQLNSLLLAKYLQKIDLGFLILEKRNQNPLFLHESMVSCRDTATVHSLTTLFEGLEFGPWECVAQEWNKDSWRAFSDGTDELFQNYFSSKKWALKTGLKGLEQWHDEISQSFSDTGLIENISAQDRVATTSLGEKIHYQNLFWSGSYASLSKACPEASKKIKLIPRLKTSKSYGVLYVDTSMETPQTDGKVLVLPFRFLENKIRAYGLVTSQSILWHIFLETKLLENKEDIAKCISSFRRELEKQFQFKHWANKITYVPELPLSCQFEALSCEITPGFFWINPELSLASGLETTFSYMDLLIGLLQSFIKDLPKNQETALLEPLENENLLTPSQDASL